MKIWSKLIVFAGIFLVFGCTKDRFLSPLNTNPTDTTLVKTPLVGEGFVYINEFVAKGSTLVSDLGNSADWVELYNPQNTDITLEAGKWFVTNDSTTKNKFQLPPINLDSKDFLVFFADDSNRVGQFIHTNFGLKSSGSYIGLFYKNSDGTFVKVDGKAFGVQASNVSLGRLPDGGSQWSTFNQPTPGASNN